MTAGRFGLNFGSTNTTPYVTAPKRPPLYGSGGSTALGPTPRGAVEHFPTSPDMLSQVAGVAMQQPAVVAERPLGLIDQIGKFLTGTATKAQKDNIPVPGPVSSALNFIGQIGFGSTADKSGDFSIGGLVRAAEAGLQEEGTWNGALMNFQDAGHIKYIEDHHLAPDAIVPWGQGDAGFFGFGSEKAVTVSGYYDSLRKRQFFKDPKTGQDLTPTDLVNKINGAGPLGAFQFGDRNVTEDPTLNAVLKMGTDPLNVAFMAGGPAFVAARYGAFSGKIMAATKDIGEWALPSVWKAAAAGKVAHGVGEVADMARLGVRLEETAQFPSAAASAQAILAGDVTKATSKGLATLLKNGMKEVFLPGSDGLVTRYYRGALRQQAAELAIEHLPGIGDQYDPQGNKISSGWFSAAHDASQSILDDHPLSGNQLFVLMTAFSMPARKLVGEYNTGRKVASEKLFGGGGDALWAKEGGFSDSLGQGKSAVSAMDKAWGEGDAGVGRDRRARLVDQLNLKISFDRIMRNPAWKLFAKSLDQSAYTAGMFEKILRGHANWLVATGKINDKMRVAKFKEWGTDHLTSYQDPVTGETSHLVFPAGFSLTKQGLIDQWIRYDKANTGLSETIGPLQGAVLGRAPVLSKEGALAIESIVRDMMDENGRVSPQATGTIRDTLAQFPASFLEPVPANTREFLATLMNEGVAAKGYDGLEIIGHLEAMAKRLPAAEDLFHEANIKEAAAPPDIYSGVGGPLQSSGVSKFHTPAQFKEHQLNSISEARQLKQDIIDSQQHFDDRWERDHHKGGGWKYKGEPLASGLDAQDVNALESYMTLSAGTGSPRASLDRAFEHTDPSTAPQTLYRNVDANELGILQSHMGREYVAPKYTSTATEGSPYLEGQATNLSTTSTVVRVEVPAGTKIIDIDAVHNHPDAMPINAGKVTGERLLPYGSKFDVRQEGDQIVLSLKPAPEAAPAAHTIVIDTSTAGFAGSKIDVPAGTITGDRLRAMPKGEPDSIVYDKLNQYRHQVVWHGPDGKPHGFAEVDTTGSRTGNLINTFSVFVDPAYRRSGVATRLYDALKGEGLGLEGSGQTVTALGRKFTEAYNSKPTPEAIAPDMAQHNLDTLRANDQAHIDGLRARLLELQKQQADIQAQGEQEGVIPLHFSFTNTHDGSLSVAPESLDLLRKQTQYIQENWPETFQVKKAPAVHIPWDMADGALGAIHQQRTNLGRIVFDYGPLAQATKFIDYLTEPVLSSARSKDAKLMLYKMFGSHGATEQEVTKLISLIQKKRGDAPKVGPMQVTVGGRGLNGFMPSELNDMAHEVWGPIRNADGKVMSEGNPQFVENIMKSEGVSHGKPDYYKIIDRASNSLVRKGEQAMLEGNYGLGGKQLLSRMFAKGYGMWQDTPFSGATRFVAQLYPMVRFTLSARWQGMNRAENFLLGMFQDGIRTMKQPVREDLQSRQMYGLAKGRVPGGMTDRSLMRPPESTVIPVADSKLSANLRTKIQDGAAPPGFDANLPDTGVYTGRFMEPAMRRQFQEGTGEKAFFAAIDELPTNAPEVKWMVDMFGPEKGTWSQQVNDMIYGWDTNGVHATMQDAERAVAAQDKWTPAQRAEIAPFLLRLEEKHAQVYKDIADIQMGNTDRSRIERLLNSYWLYWPLSYQIKTTRWMVDLLSNKAFGHQTNLGGAYMLTHGRDMIQQQMESNPEFADQMANNGTLWMMANMIFPAVPWDQAVSLSRIPRYVGANVMHWFPTYAGLDNPGDYASKAMQLGPLYDASLVSQFLKEKGSFVQGIGGLDTAGESESSSR